MEKTDKKVVTKEDLDRAVDKVLAYRPEKKKEKTKRSKVSTKEK